MILIVIFEDLVDSSSKKKIDGQFLAPCDRNARLLVFLRFELLSTPEVLPSLFPFSTATLV